MKTAIVMGEFKVTDGNYGNSTRRIEIKVEADNLRAAIHQMDLWEFLERKIAFNGFDGNPDEMTHKEYKAYQSMIDERDQALASLTAMAVE